MGATKIRATCGMILAGLVLAACGNAQADPPESQVQNCKTWAGELSATGLGQAIDASPRRNDAIAYATANFYADIDDADPATGELMSDFNFVAFSVAVGNSEHGTIDQLLDLYGQISYTCG